MNHIKCFHCNIYFSLTQFNYHLKTFKTTRYECSICNKIFDYIYSYKAHTRTHLEKKPKNNKKVLTKQINSDEIYNKFQNVNYNNNQSDSISIRFTETYEIKTIKIE